MYKYFSTKGGGFHPSPNYKLENKEIDKQIRVLLFSIDFDVLHREVDPYTLNLKHGWYGIVLLLHFAQRTFNPDYPNYNLFEPSRKNIIASHKEKSEKEIESEFQSPATRRMSAKKGIANGLAGIGLLYLLFPEAIEL